MTLELTDLGTLAVRTGHSWRFTRGPLGGRSTSILPGATWESERVRAKAVWINGTYRSGRELAEVNVRAMLETDDGALLYLDYFGRFRPQLMASEGGPVMMAGRIETPDERYDWLNAIQVVGRGTLADDVMSYEMYALE